MTRKNTKKTAPRTTKLDDRALTNVSGGALGGYDYSKSSWYGGGGITVR